jgi:ParB family chromosome partitioning protein
MNADKRRALGKGLSALLPQRSVNAPITDEPPPAREVEVPAAEPPEPVVLDGHARLVPTERIRPNPLLPRVTFDEHGLAELAASIRENGIIQPLIVRPLHDGDYQLIAGERRLRAANLAGLAEVPVVLSDASSDKLLLHALIENIQREDLNPLETAEAMMKLRHQLNLSHEEIADRTGKDRSTVTNLLRLLKLPEDVQLLVAERRLSMGHARALLGIEDREELRSVANRAAAQGYSVRQLERIVSKRTADPSTAESEPEPKQDANVRAAITTLEHTLGTRVRIIENNSNRGRIEIEYYSQDDLQRIYLLITKES